MLDTPEFERTALIAFILEAQLYDLASALHERVEALGLRVATAQGGNSGDVLAFFVFFDQHRKFARGASQADSSMG